jgi:hypothetical protein
MTIPRRSHELFVAVLGVRGGGVPLSPMAAMPALRIGPPPRSFAADAHACIMVGVTATHRIQGCGASSSCPDSELDVFLAAQRRHADAQAAGIVICPGVGFHVIPTDCLAAVLKQALPDATHLVLAFDARTRASRGTARTMAESFLLLGQAPAGGYYTPSRLMGARCVELLSGSTPIRVD